jgi:DNA-binding transcriptional ArsR family regulator
VETNQVNGFDALGDPTRRSILERLADGPRSVGELARDLPVSRPAVSQHLRVLRLAGLVTDEAQGTRRIYRIDPRGIAALRDQLDRFWDQALAAFKAAAEEKEGNR